MRNGAAYILVINDDPPMLDQMSRWLSWAGFQVQTSKTGYQGTQLASHFIYDLIVIDFNLKADREGSKTALNFIPAFLKVNPNTPIIVTSATQELLSIPALLKMGAKKVLLADRFFYKNLIRNVKLYLAKNEMQSDSKTVPEK